MIQRITKILEEVEVLCRSKKNMSLPIRQGFTKAMWELRVLRRSNASHEELGIAIGGIRKTRKNDLLVKVKCATRDRGRLDSAFLDVVGSRRN